MYISYLFVFVQSGVLLQDLFFPLSEDVVVLLIMYNFIAPFLVLSANKILRPDKYIVKTNKSQKIKNILQNNIENCIKYIGIINLFISIIVFLIYITLSFLKIIKFNYISIFLFFIMLFLSLFSILLSFWMKRNNISSNYLKRNYIIKELIGLDNDYL